MTPLRWFALAVVAAVALSGCAHGTDGARQGCTNTDTIIEGGYSTSGALLKVDLPKMRAALPTGGQAALDRMHAHETAYGKTLGVLDSARSLKEGSCKAVDGADALKQKDIDAVMADLAQIAVKVEQAVAELKGALQK